MKKIIDGKQYSTEDAAREGYGIDQIRNTMTVCELIAYLDQFDDDTAGDFGTD